MDYKIPNLGENIKGGDVVKVLVKAGDTVKDGQTLFELETDKAVLEVPAPCDGVIQEIRVAEGTKANVGDVCAVIETSGAVPAKAAPVAAPAPAPVPEPKPAPEAAPIPPASTPPSVVAAPTPRASSTQSSGSLVAAPSIRKLARELNVDLAAMEQAGYSGRVTKEEVQAFAGGATNSTTAPAVVDLPSFEQKSAMPVGQSQDAWGTTEVMAMTKIRKVTACNMEEAWTTIPHVTQHDEANVTETLKLREKYAKRVEKAGGKLTLTAVMIKVLGSALKTFPDFNASIDMINEQIIYKKYVNVGVAVDTPNGLFVPVIKNVDKKNVIELAIELNSLAQKARDRKLSLDEMQGGCISLTNLGGIAGTGFTPIIRKPEAAIIGMSRTSIKPVLVEDKWVPQTFLPLSLSYDHRLIDGAQAARFLRWVADAFEEPFLMELEG